VFGVQFCTGISPAQSYDEHPAPGEDI
jgi:hypothetical protein